MKNLGNKNQGKSRGQKSNNVVETFKDIGSSAADSLKQDLFAKMPQDFMDQLFGPQSTGGQSGELYPGTTAEFNPQLKKKNEENNKLITQVAFERRLFQEERVLIQQRTNELRMQLKVLTDEVLLLAQSTQNLSKEISVAAMQVSGAEPGVYHVFFFERIVEFIRSFRSKVEDATLWMGTANKRAEKKNYWSKYKKHGSKFLLSADHYLTRSAG